MEIKDKVSILYAKHRILILYGIIGGLSVFVDFAVFGLLSYFFPKHYLLVNAISVNCGIINSFLLNRHLNFKVKNKLILRFMVFYLVGLAGLLISSGLLFLMVNFLEMNLFISKIATIFVVTVFQFTLNKNVTFKSNG